MTGRGLIVNADDFGQGPGINRGVIRALKDGVVTSASLMVRWPAAAAAAGYVRGRPDVSVGLHLDLGEWVFRDGNWGANYEVVDLQDADAVGAELVSQLDAFSALMGRMPTHLDSHQHVHHHEPLRSFAIDAARRLGVPLRDYTPGIRYCGSFYGQTGEGESLPGNVTVEALLGIIEGLAPGITELGCHPGEGEIDSVYATERERELAVLCDRRVAVGLHDRNVQLRSFSDVSRSLDGG